MKDLSKQKEQFKTEFQMEWNKNIPLFLEYCQTIEMVNLRVSLQSIAASVNDINTKLNQKG